MKPIFTALGPNATWRDCAYAARLIVSPSRWLEGASCGELERAVKGITGLPYSFSFESGRTALTMLLRSLRFSARDEVLVQAYTCVAVPNAVLWAGLVPRYVDIDPRTLNLSPTDLEKKISPHTKALVVQHTFGMPASMDEIGAIAKKHGLFLIEDCAHSLGAMYHGKAMGSFGDAAFFSFGRDKAVSSVFGGALAVRDAALAQRVEEEARALTWTPAAWVVQQLLHSLITTVARTLYNSLSIGKMILAAARISGLLSKPVEPSEKKGNKPSFAFHRMPNALCELALSGLRNLEAANAHRRECAAHYAQELSDLPMLLPHEDKGVRSIYLRYCIQTDKAEELTAYARRRGIFLGDWYRQPIAPEGVTYASVGYQLGSCPHAEQSARESVNLPTDIHIARADRERIITCVRDFFSQAL